MSVYTTSVENDMREIGTFTRESADEFAAKIGVSVKSVITKINRMDGVNYVKPDVQAKPKTRQKSEIVDSVASLLTMDGKNPLWGLERATTLSLKELEARVGEVLVEAHQSYMDDVADALDGNIPAYYGACVGDVSDDVEDTANESQAVNG